ncbi:MAG: phospholipase/carboxylesterase [Verrucomicrobiales bacterium]|jgi:phospholipase/carboxylesterase
MSDSPLSCLEIGALREEAELCVILMHGLGADGHDFEDVASGFSEAALPDKWRFVLPHAPQIPVTINMGMTMPAWYDILDMSQPREVDWGTVEQSQRSIETLLDNECASRIILAGFSQGAAMALHVGLRQQASIAGILAMSGYLLEGDAHPCPSKAGDFPIGVFHGSDDPVVPLVAAEHAVSMLQTSGFETTFKVYAEVEHSLCDEEIRDVFEWLSGISQP